MNSNAGTGGVTRWAVRIATALLLTTRVWAQLAGTYTIDASTPTGGNNYQTFQAAANALSAQGVSGPVTFVAQPSALPYSAFSLDQVPGTSPVNVVTFLGSGASTVLAGDAPGFTATVRFGTSPSINLATSGTGPSHIVFDSFEVRGASGTAIMSVGCDSVIVRNCVAHTSGCGIGLTACSSSVIEDCEVYGTNHVPGIGGNTNYSGGIYAYYLSTQNIVQRNRVHDCADNGIFIGSYGPAFATPDNICINNFVWNCAPPGGALYAGGLAFRRATNSVVANNSVSMPAGSSFPALRLMGGNTATTPLMVSECSNNVVQHLGSGPCVQTEFSTPVNFPATFDHNLYDAAGGGPVGGVGLGGSLTTIPTLSAWQTTSGQESNSISAPAGFLTPTDLHLASSSAAYNAGTPVPGVGVDIDGDPRPLGGGVDIGADEYGGVGSGVLSGPALSAIGAPLQYDLSLPAGSAYIFDISASGTAPGIALPGLGVIPLNRPLLGYDFGAVLPPGLIQNFVGVSPVSGLAHPTLNLPPDPGLIGLQLYASFVTVDPMGPFGIGYIGNWVTTSVSGVPPTISGLVPGTSPQSGNFPAVISGTGFQTGAQVTIGGASATAVTVVDPQTITCSTPPGPLGPADVTVTNPDTLSVTLPGGLLYVENLVLTGVTPLGATPGTLVTITGTGLQVGLTLDIGGIAVPPINVTPTSITYSSPVGLPCGAIATVTNPDSQVATIEVNPSPNVASVLPSSGPAAGGGTFFLIGTNFLSGTTVTVGGVPASTVVNGSTLMTVTAPPGSPGPAAVVVTSLAGCSTSTVYNYL